MEYSIDVIINLILYCLYLILFVGTIVGGFISPALGLQVAGFIVPAIMILTAIWLLFTGWDYLLQALAILLSIATNGLNFVLGNIVTLIGAAWAFLAGMGEAALIAVSVWWQAKLALLWGGMESFLAALGIGLESGHWLIDMFISLFGLFGTGLAIFAHFAGTGLYAIGYGFGSIVVILLNLVAVAVSSLTMLAGATPTLAMLAGGAVALMALPFLVKALLALVVHIVHQASLLALRASIPIWQSSWLLGWIAKMLMSCVALAFYLERSLTHRPTITLNWNGEQWAVA